MSRPSVPPERASNERKAAAAPPLYLLTIVLIPIAAAIYIASTRFTDYKHTGFDVLFGSLEGIVAAWFAFRYYHPPIGRGAGWAWGPRHRSTAFGITPGVGSYGIRAHSKGKQSQVYDIEQGVVSGGPTEGVELHELERAGTAGESYRSERALV